MICELVVSSLIIRGVWGPHPCGACVLAWILIRSAGTRCLAVENRKSSRERETGADIGESVFYQIYFWALRWRFALDLGTQGEAGGAGGEPRHHRIRYHSTNEFN